MSTNKGNLKQYVNILASRLTNSRVLFMILLIGVTLGYMSFRVQKIIGSEVDNDKVGERISQFQGKPLDISSIDLINQLESRNISLESIFDPNRDNPFEKNN